MGDETRQPSHRLTFEDAIDVHRRLRRGEFVHRIAAHFDVNPGRVAEVKRGVLHPGSLDAAITGSGAAQPRLI